MRSARKKDFPVGCMITAVNHSHELIRRSKECVINVPTVDLAEKVVRIGNCSGREVQKFVQLELTPAKAAKVKAPLIARQSRLLSRTPSGQMRPAHLPSPNRVICARRICLHGRNVLAGHLGRSGDVTRNGAAGGAEIQGPTTARALAEKAGRRR